MTKLTKPVVREVESKEYQSNQPFIVTLDAKVLRIRVKRRKGEYVLRYEDLWNQGARQAVTS
jgi:hypothetical protein